MSVQTGIGELKLMLTEEDQKALLELLAVNAIYLNVVTENPNPFVKKLVDTDKEKALAMLIRSINNLEYLVPLAMSLIVENKEDTEPKVDLTSFE